MSVADGKTPPPPPLKRTSQRLFTFRLFLISFPHAGDLCFKPAFFKATGMDAFLSRVEAILAGFKGPKGLVGDCRCGCWQWKEMSHSRQGQAGPADPSPDFPQMPSSLPHLQQII